MKLPLFGYHQTSLVINFCAMQGPDMRLVRRHYRTFASYHSSPVVHAVTGNWVSAKAKGSVNGEDLSCYGQVCHSMKNAYSLCINLPCE